jgi:hypothetical protein
MKLAIMQPYLFPYVGYFQLVAAVDKFVFYDDVNFIKNGWINRNRLVLSGNVNYFTFPLSGASAFSKINQIIVKGEGRWRRKISESLRCSYSKAPNYALVNQMFSEIIFSDEISMSELAKRSIISVSNYLGFATEFVMSSSCYENSDLRGCERVLDICCKEGASHYYNLPGGRELYDSALFASKGINLCFIEPKFIQYRQLSEEFHPGLSIIDMLMFVNREFLREMLYAEARR